MSRPRRKSEMGQGLVEYALILVAVAVALIVGLILLGPSVGEIIDSMICELIGTCEDTESAQLSAQAIMNPYALDSSATRGNTISKIAKLENQARLQEHRLHKTAALFQDFLLKSLENIGEIATDDGDIDLADDIELIRNDVADGEYQDVSSDITDLIADIMVLLTSTPEKIQDRILRDAQQFERRFCSELRDAVVPQQLFDDVEQAIDLQEQEHPGSTGDALTLLAEAQDIVNDRNAFIAPINVACSDPS